MNNDVEMGEAPMVFDRQRNVDSLREQVERLESLVEGLNVAAEARLPEITSLKLAFLIERPRLHSNSISL